MYDEERQRIVKGAIDMLQSLIIAIDEAGGGISIERLRKMTVDDLFCHLGTNGIRFICVPLKKTKGGE